MIRTRLSPCRAKRGALPIQTVTVDALLGISVICGLCVDRSVISVTSAR